MKQRKKPKPRPNAYAKPVNTNKGPATQKVRPLRKPLPRNTKRRPDTNSHLKIDRAY